MEKRKIINDPVFGFIDLPTGFLYEVFQHPYLHRLSRIRQLGMSPYVYPGAQHTRFQHTTGAMYLMDEAIAHLKAKGLEITPEEAEAVTAAILLHDIGHGPFSHVLEHSLIQGLEHETISLRLMERMNLQFHGRLSLAIQIFKDTYSKKFLHQLVSGNLDMDRLDYLRRDSFYTGVVEGSVGSDRILKMLNVKNDKLVIEAKGIYSIENFLMSRRLMYWQVYLHKTSLAAEKMLQNLLRRACELSKNGQSPEASPALSYFINNNQNPGDLTETDLDWFIQLDDVDIWDALKRWQNHPDFVLSTLSKMLLNRNLFKIEMTNEPPQENRLSVDLEHIANRFNINVKEAAYFTSMDCVSSNMYNEVDDDIEILLKNGETIPITRASDMFNLDLLSKEISKYIYAYVRLS